VSQGSALRHRGENKVDSKDFLPGEAKREYKDVGQQPLRGKCRPGALERP
jgi:hypothetical protein